MRTPTAPSNVPAPTPTASSNVLAPTPAPTPAPNPSPSPSPVVRAHTPHMWLLLLLLLLLLWLWLLGRTTTTTTTTGTEDHPSLGKHPLRNASRQGLLRPCALRFRYSWWVSSSSLQPTRGALRPRPCPHPCPRGQSLARATCDHTKWHG